MNRIASFHTNVVFHHTEDGSKPVLELVLNYVEQDYILDGDAIVSKPKVSTIRLAGIGADSIRNFATKLIEEAERIAALGAIERGAVVLAGENKVLRDLLGEAGEVIKNIDGESHDEAQRLIKLTQQIENARFGHA